MKCFDEEFFKYDKKDKSWVGSIKNCHRVNKEKPRPKYIIVKLQRLKKNILLDGKSQITK
jgi:hypothetical protein